jgi:hypothetical protein
MEARGIREPCRNSMSISRKNLRTQQIRGRGRTPRHTRWSPEARNRHRTHSFLVLAVGGLLELDGSLEDLCAPRLLLALVVGGLGVLCASRLLTLAGSGQGRRPFAAPPPRARGEALPAPRLLVTLGGGGWAEPSERRASLPRSAAAGGAIPTSSSFSSSAAG